jgi:shikimate dehydrogenase
VTIPHKEAVVPLLDDLDPLARTIGAVNTVSRQGARLKGWNTDVVGFRRALAETSSSAERVAIIGAGGAARAVVAALLPTAEQVWVIARNLEQARRLSTDLGIERGGAVDMNQMREVIARVDLVVNATPSDLPPAGWLRPDQRLFDLRSRRSVEGRAMLLHQGAASFEIWTGHPAPLLVMRHTLERSAVLA